LFGEEKGGIPSEASFLSSGRRAIRGAPRTKNRYQNHHKNYTRIVETFLIFTEMLL
jgi:hypothetical protein